MSTKKKFYLRWAILALLAVIMIFVGLYYKKDMFFSMGFAMLFVMAVRIVRDGRIIRDEEKLRQLEIAQKDERNIYLAQKSYSWAFWISIWAEYAALLVFSFMDLTVYSKIFAYIVCIQLIIYVILRAVFNKKY